MSGIAQNLLQAFGGSVNLTTVLALLGGWTGISMILLSPIMAFIIHVKWSPQKKNLVVWAASFVVIGIGMYIAHAFTGSLWDIGTWATAWGALGLGATGLHDKLWGTNGNGLSTFIEKNYFPGTSVAIPTSKEELLPAAEAIAKEMFNNWLKSKGENIAKAATKQPIYTGAGTAGAFPNPDSAPLTGGAKLTVTPSTGVAAVAQNLADSAHASTGENVVSEGVILPTAAAPTITHPPEDVAKIAAITAAIAAGEPVEEMVTEDHYEPQAG